MVLIQSRSVQLEQLLQEFSLVNELVFEQFELFSPLVTGHLVLLIKDLLRFVALPERGHRLVLHESE